MSLFDYNKVAGSRRNTWDRFIIYATEVPLGAGLSRTGAAGGKFADQINSADDPFGNAFHTDNFWLATIIDLGIPGSFLLSLLIAAIFLRGLKYLKKIQHPDHRLVHLSLLCGIFGSGVGMYGAEAMLYNPEASYFWFFSGCLIALQERSLQIDQNT